jgi:hypothetical protein
LAELCGTGGQVARGGRAGRAGRAGLRYGFFIYYGQLSLRLGGSDRFPGCPENTRGGVGQGTNVKGGDHALTSKSKPLRCWEVKTWYSTILLDSKYPQSRPKPYSWREILSVQLHCDGLLQLLSASRCACLGVLLVHPHMLNIIFEGKNKINKRQSKQEAIVAIIRTLIMFKNYIYSSLTDETVLTLCVPPHSDARNWVSL